MRWTCVLLVIAAFLAPAAPVWAQASVLEVIPDDALGFALVNRVGQTNDKFEALAKRLKIPVPGGPLEMFKNALGAQQGIAETGSIAVAINKIRPLIATSVKARNGPPTWRGPGSN